MLKSESERYFRRQFAGGRRLPGRILDYIALRAILFLACYLMLRQQLPEGHAAWLLAAISLIAASLLIRILREALYARFKARERKRLLRQVLLDRLMLLPTNEFLRLCDTILEFGRIPCPLQCAEPADRDAVLRFARAAGDRPISLFSTAGFTKGAEAFAARGDIDVRLVPVEKLLTAAERSRACPTEEELEAEIVRLASAGRVKRRRAAAQPLTGVRVNKYLLTAALLTGASFLAGYALYYRLLAGLCMLLALLSAALRYRQTPHAT